MIPRVAKSGRSFIGAVLYYSHDKEAKTSERLGFVELVNLPILPSDDRVRDLERAGAIMAWTAIHQEEIKQLHHQQTSPGTPFRRSGRKLEKPVYSFSLRFAPEDAARIDEAMLKRAAHGALKALGMERCQAAIVEHKDSIPPHVHVLVCPIDPKTGQTVNRQKDFYKLSRFAQAFSREHGLRILHEREKNNDRRRRGEIVKYKGLTRSEWEIVRGYRNKTRAKVERERFEQQQADRIQLSKRQHDEIARFKAFLAKTWKRDRDAIDAEIKRRRAREAMPGIFARASRAVRRLTGRAREESRELAQLIKTRDNITLRMNEARIPLARKLRDQRLALENRHKAEVLRDQQYFEARARGQSESDRAASAQRKKSFLQASRDRRGDGLDSILEELRTDIVADAHPDKIIDDFRQSLAGETEPRRGKWSRAAGRNEDRPKRPRRPRNVDRNRDGDRER